MEIPNSVSHRKLLETLTIKTYPFNMSEDDFEYLNDLHCMLRHLMEEREAEFYSEHF